MKQILRRLWTVWLMALMTGCGGTAAPADIPAAQSATSTQSTTPVPGTIPFTTIKRGSGSSYGGSPHGAERSEPQKLEFLTFTDAAAFKAFWQEHRGEPGAEPPAIDFTSQMVVAVIEPWLSTGGYKIDVEQLVQEEDQIRVVARSTSPGPDCIVITAFTRPFHIIALPRSSDRVLLDLRTAVDYCAD